MATVPTPTNKAAVVDHRVSWNYDLNSLPSGKVQFLNRDFVAAYGENLSVERAREFGFIAWCGLPDRDRAAEIALGLHVNKTKDSPGFDYESIR